MGWNRLEERGVTMNRLPIIGYEGLYWIDKEGRVTNASGHELKTTQTSSGKSVSLYKLGQRTIVPISCLKPRGDF